MNNKGHLSEARILDYFLIFRARRFFEETLHRGESWRSRVDSKLVLALRSGLKQFSFGKSRELTPVWRRKFISHV